MSPARISRFSPLAGLFVLLLVGCGGHATVTGTSASSPSVSFTSSPPLESTGPESTSPGGGGGGGGGIAIDIPGLPIGNQGGSDIGNNECIAFQWTGTTIPHGITVTITSVAVVGGDFTTVSPAAAGCHSPVCLGFQWSAANTTGGICYAGVQYTGPPLASDSSVMGQLRFAGELSCPNVNLATCQGYSSKMPSTPQVPITYNPPTPSGSGSPPDSGSP